MRVNFLSRLLALAMVLSLCFTLPALAADCALCGQETGSDAYLCADCLLALLNDEAAAGGLEITGVTVNADGSVTLCWEDSASNGPYCVYYEPLNNAPVPFGWTAAQNVQGNAITLSQLVPGVTYVFTVTDAAGHQADYVFCTSAPKEGNEIGAIIRLKTRQRNSRSRWEAPFSASEIMQDNSLEHGLYVKLAYSMLRKTRNYAFSVTVEAPNGFADVVFSGRIQLNYGKSEVPAWSFVCLDDYFSYLERYYGGVPTGSYRVTLNFDGKPACSGAFTVGE